MAALMMEILYRSGSQFHKIERPVTRVGRALDNDVILSDPTVSPYHFVIRKSETGTFELRAIADENGIRVGRRLIEEPVDLTDLPFAFDAGRTHIRILDRQQAVAPTRLLSCRSGGLCVFGHWGWALGLFVVFALISALDNYLSTPQQLSWKSYGADQVVVFASALSLVLLILFITRIVAHHWDMSSALSFVSAVLALGLLLDLMLPFADYFFSSPLPGFLISLLWVLVLLPWAAGWFLIRLHHGHTGASVLFVVLLFTPIAYLQLKEVAAYYNLFDQFSRTAHYSNALLPWDGRLQSTLTIDGFADLMTRAELAGQTSSQKP